jgi:polyvinyl alcohol dehydrogenase (cytochrome)
MLYVTTGNSYSVPEGYCVDPGQTNCTALPPDAYIDSIVALNFVGGKVAWAHHTPSADT